LGSSTSIASQRKFTCTKGVIAEEQTAEGKHRLFVGIDRTAKLAVAQRVETADRKTA